MNSLKLLCTWRLAMPVVLVALAIHYEAKADDDVWKTAANGTWSAGMNWVDGTVPDSAVDRATIDKAGTYTVTFSGDPATIGDLALAGAANVTFASGARPPNPIEPRTLTLIDVPGTEGSLRVNGGAILTLGATSGTPAANHPFSLDLDGSLFLSGGATVNARFGSHIDSSQMLVGVAGQNGTGTLSLTSSAVATTNQVGIGNGGSSGIATVSGIGTRWDIANALQIGVDTPALPGGNGTLTVTAGAVVESGDAIVGQGTGGVTGTVTVTGDSALWRAASLRIGGGGVVQVQPGAALTVEENTLVTGGLLRLQGGVLDTSELSAANGFEWSAGTLHVGTIDNDFNQHAGTLAPGHSAGVTNVLGDFNTSQDAKIEIEVGGPGQGTEYDVINSTQRIVLGCELNLKLINGFIPSPSQTFVIMNSQALPIDGAFNNVPNGARLGVVGGGSFRVSYGAESAFVPALVVLSDFQVGNSSGDFDLDGDVDGNDFLIWQRGGSPSPLSQADLGAWKNNFGAAAVSASIPEPTSAVLATLSVMTATLSFAHGRKERPARSARSAGRVS